MEKSFDSTSIALLIQPPAYEKRSAEQLRQHYEVEKELAERLRTADAASRPSLYPTLYDALYSRVPLHPRLTRKFDPQRSAEVVHDAMCLLRRFLRPGTVFLEIGAGDCGLSLEVSRQVKKVYALEVSLEATKHLMEPPPNLEIIISDGRSIPLPQNGVTLAYSNQVMEHVHPDDASAQLENIYRALAPGGLYVCITPNRLSGPHDISKYFDHVAVGMHMREYTVGELRKLFRKSGFSKVQAMVGLRKRYSRIPPVFIETVEWILDRLPSTLRRRVAMSRGFDNFLFVTLVATK